MWSGFTAIESVESRFESSGTGENTEYQAEKDTTESVDDNGSGFNSVKFS